MFKNSIIIAVIFFAVFTLKDLIFDEKIQWIENIVVFVLAFLTYTVFEWVKTPYEWNKNIKER
ncbi:hypothetical protein [Lentibacillus amyloliquefaciens]|uniref:Uncharacterized protein n=1 Tax=Lentibacillus amyloliquefaciens TaxID=1472767 RepID=A0A0U4DQ97_9BACI|nr:hypothetical protein [Lentibacillus amyloliquefaciens]ALX47512.1 hypothetical protein AOX59_02175 [Lentibacillus amyloliquefaciens]